MEPKLQRRVQRYGWDKASAFYEDSWSKQLEPAQNRLMEMADLKPGEKVLDMACGTGLVSFRAAELVGPTGSVLGTDISENMVKAATEVAKANNITNITFERRDTEDLQLDDNNFDVALDSLGLMYYPVPLKACEEMGNALKSGGRVVAAVWGQRDHCGWAEIFPIVDSRVETDVCPLFFQLGTQDALVQTFSIAEFINVDIDRITTTLYYESPEEACSAVFAGGPVALAYSRFDDETKEEAHAEYIESIKDFWKEDHYEIPGEFVIGIGYKA
jgi:ubiquinone/menaquinone biosynthesis C-methylase UbiE